MTELTRRSFLAGAAAVATAPVVGTAHAKDTKVPRPDVKADYPAAGKTQALFDRVPDVEPDVANSGTFDFGVLISRRSGLRTIWDMRKSRSVSVQDVMLFRWENAFILMRHMQEE